MALRATGKEVLPNGRLEFRLHDRLRAVSSIAPGAYAPCDDEACLVGGRNCNQGNVGLAERSCITPGEHHAFSGPAPDLHPNLPRASLGKKDDKKPPVHKKQTGTEEVAEWTDSTRDPA